MPRITLDQLRRYAVGRTLFDPTTLGRAIERLGFVQADPIRAPARAQDLTLRHRVRDYRAGDLERRYPKLPIEEDCLVNYGFLPRPHVDLMQPRTAKRPWDAATQRKAAEVLAFIHERGPTHPRDVERQFAHGRTTNWFGGTSNAATQLLDGMHYRGLLRVARRDGGTRVYAAAVRPPPQDDGPEARARRAATLLELVVRKYAPLPASTLVYLARLLINYGAPHLADDTRAALKLARSELASTQIDGVTWYWPGDENPASRRHGVDDAVRLLAPFDPIVWDRDRFELLWDWRYRFEANVPAAQRKLGYYALPLLWRDRVIGWGTIERDAAGHLRPTFGYVDAASRRDAALRRERDAELQRLRAFLQSRD
jgi:uncharacterized protein YcaQ